MIQKAQNTKNINSKVYNNKQDKSFNLVGKLLLVVSILFIVFPLVYLLLLVYSGWLGNDAVGLGALYLQPLFMFGTLVAFANIIYFGFIDTVLIHGSIFTVKKIIVYLSAVFAVTSFVIIFITPSGMRDVIYLFYSNDEVQQTQYSEQQERTTQEVTIEEVRILISSCSITSIVYLESNGTIEGIDVNVADTSLVLVKNSSENEEILYVADKISEPIRSIFEESREKCPYIKFYDYTI
jgi:hypothetical protein